MSVLTPVRDPVRGGTVLFAFLGHCEVDAGLDFVVARARDRHARIALLAIAVRLPFGGVQPFAPGSVAPCGVEMLKSAVIEEACLLCRSTAGKAPRDVSVDFRAAYGRPDRVLDRAREDSPAIAEVVLHRGLLRVRRLRRWASEADLPVHVL